MSIPQNEQTQEFVERVDSMRPGQARDNFFALFSEALAIEQEEQTQEATKLAIEAQKGTK